MNDTVFSFFIDMYIGAMVFLTATFIYHKISVMPINKTYNNPLVLAIGTAIIAVVYAALYTISNPIAQTILDLYPCVFFIIFEKENILKRCFICFFATCINLLLFLFSSVFIYIVFALTGTLFLREYVFLFLYILIFFLAFIFLRIKRFKKGFQFFQDAKRIGFGVAIGGVLFILFSFVRFQKHGSDLMEIIILIVITVICLFMYFWIRRSITAHYRERLQLKSEERFQELLKEKDEENARLSQSNEFLARVVHRDNHLMASLDSSINAYFESSDKEFKDDLLREIQTLAKERGELINKEQRDSKLLPSTGNILIDGAIGDLYIKAAAHGIDFDLTVSETVDEIIGKYITQIELQTLLCDHIKDAVIAVDATGKDNGKILVDFSVKNDDYTIAVFDNGVEFETEILAKLGKERVTGHAESGGSGIGFMTTFETLSKAHASLSITEFENKTPFSKSVSFIFNGENSFIIKSYRADQLKAAINREDVVIL